MVAFSLPSTILFLRALFWERKVFQESVLRGLTRLWVFLSITLSSPPLWYVLSWGTLLPPLSQSLKGKVWEEGRGHSVSTNYLNVLPLQTSSAPSRPQTLWRQRLDLWTLYSSCLGGGKKKTVLSVGMLTQVVCNVSESQMLSPDTLPMETGPKWYCMTFRDKLHDTPRVSITLLSKL